MSSHEDIRYHVIRKLEKAIREAIQEIGEKEPELYYKLSLEEYRKIIEKGEYIPLIVKNERFLKGIGRSDIELFGGKILIEVEVKDSDFPIAFKQLQNYISYYPDIEYCIITNDSKWIIYDHNLKEIKELKDVIKELKEEIIKPILIKGIKIIPSTENIKKIFQSIMLFEEDLFEIFKNSDIKNSALFKAYSNIIAILYGGIPESVIESLYIKHTLMQMIVSACLTTSLRKIANSIEACSGEKIEIEMILPYLKWWEALLKSRDSNIIKFLNSLLDSIYSKALLIDWEKGNKEDTFRELYEILIDAETRRKIGEYYTPLWLVEFMIKKVSDTLNGLKGKEVLDPFCGSGTFLVKAFYKKIDEGESPDEAIKEIIGFDINPLAVSIARAELMMAYQSIKKDKKIATPLIFNADSASILLRGKTEILWYPTSFLDELKIIEERISNYIDVATSTLANIDISEFLKIEMVLREYFREATSKNTYDEIINILKNRLNRLKIGSSADIIIEALKKDECINAIARLIEKYGNGIWAVSITSLFAPQIIREKGVDVIITNPPWSLLTDVKGAYGELLRKTAKRILGEGSFGKVARDKKIRKRIQEKLKKIPQIIAGADKASILLYGCINPAKSVVSFVMPKEAVYSADSYYGLGKILTYEIVKKFGGEIFDIKFDAFQHGNYPDIITINKKGKEFKCYIMDLKPKVQYSKTLHLQDIEISLKEVEDYTSYINNIQKYTITTIDVLTSKLDVSEVVPMGDYIRGLIGGVKKKGAKEYAGLIFDLLYSDATTSMHTIKLSNINSNIKIPEKLLTPYWKKLIYPDSIYPFYISYIYDVILSSESEEDLKSFLENRIAPNVLDKNDKEKIETLISEVKQPKELKFLNSKKYYVVYRCNRTFASVVLKPEEMRSITNDGKYNIVIESHCSYLATENKIKAYYYSAILNYLVYKVIEKCGAFERSQFARPLIAVLNANLEWKNESWQIKVAELSEKLHEIAPKHLSNIIRKGMQVKECFKILQEIEEFKEIIRIIDNKVDKNKLLEAIKQVSRIK
ncbi:MAG: N-6 DNA methylase [Candidatus Methanomethylicaceae archaeon]